MREPIPKRIVELLREAVKSGASLRDLAIWCDVSYQTIWHILKGLQKEAKPETIAQIERGVKAMTIHALLTEQLLDDTINGRDLQPYIDLIRSRQ